MCKFYHSLLILRKNFENSDRSMYAICVINFVHNLRCLLKNLRSQQKFYATAGCTGCDKYELCLLLLFLLFFLLPYSLSAPFPRILLFFHLFLLLTSFSQLKELYFSASLAIYPFCNSQLSHYCCFLTQIE